MSVTHTEWSVADLPMSRTNGTGKRRKLVIFRGTNTDTSDTIDVSGTAEPNAADIEGYLWCSIAGASIGAGSLLPSWSTNVITLDTAVGEHELGIIVNLT
jgi:hypothetical protein